MAFAGRVLGAATTLAVAAATGVALHLPVVAEASDLPMPDPCGKPIELPYVAVGDGVPFGAKKVDDTNAITKSERFPEELTKLLQAADFPFCLHNVSQGETTTDDYQNENTDTGLTQQSIADRLSPRLITVTLGREQDLIREHIDKCMTLIKNHQFIEANACALAIYSGGPWKKLNDDLTEILGQITHRLAEHPYKAVAVLGYYNPYPRAEDVITEIASFCSDLQDTMPTCTLRWMLLPPVLVTMDQITKKLNSTIEEVVKKFSSATQGSFYFVNPYEAFEDHCMEMQVQVQTQVYHPTNVVHPHNSDEDFGCSDPWIESDGDAGHLPPWHYLPPAVTGVLVFTTQTTSGMGAYPDTDGHECLAKLIYNAKGDENNGYRPLKQKLGIAEEAEADPC